MGESKNILLVDPPQNNYHKGMKKKYPSGALILLGTLCYNLGHNVKIVDMATEEIDITELKDIIKSFKTDIFAVTENTFQTKFSKMVIDACKDVDPNILTVIGGPHPSSIGLRIFEEIPLVDVSVVGEGEITFLEIVKGVDLKAIKGICYNNKMNEPRPFAENLDDIPLPKLDLVDINKYTGLGKNSENSMYIMASRGCPSHCIYCNKSVFGHKVRYRKPSKVIEEVKWLYEQYGIKNIYFQDDTFNLNRKWIEEILNLIIDNNLNETISFQAPFRANKSLVDEELLQLVKKAGFKRVLYGVESGNQNMLNTMKKGLKIEEVRRAFKLTNDAGLDSLAFFMIGLPGENEKTIKDTLDLQKELNSDSGLSLATPFPNTEFDQMLRDKGHLLNDNYDDYHYSGCYIRTDELTSDEIESYHALINLSKRNKLVAKLPVLKIAKNRLFRKLYHFYNNTLKN
ncbi:B12-binding domain-containing radical SAM protein [Methanolobus tindarius]|nr:B12-binding domain-containing radical SAM protein [Methanolobus tindarius]